MTLVRACVRPYVHIFLTATPHSLFGGIDSNIIENYYRCLFVRKKRMVKIFLDRVSLVPHRCEFVAYQGNVWLSGIRHTHCPTWRLYY